MTFEEKIHESLYQYLLSQNEIDTRFPDAIDIEDKWPSIGQSYMVDGIREFRDYPTVSLGWMMYVGMAVAKFWDEEWEIYGNLEDLYLYLRDKEGFDSMDEYVRRDVLQLHTPDYDTTEALVQSCAEMAYSTLRHENIEPGTQQAFEAYIACLHQLYLMGAAVQLYRMGYKMQALG